MYKHVNPKQHTPCQTLYWKFDSFYTCVYSLFSNYKFKTANKIKKKIFKKLLKQIIESNTQKLGNVKGKVKLV